MHLQHQGYRLCLVDQPFLFLDSWTLVLIQHMHLPLAEKPNTFTSRDTLSNHPALVTYSHQTGSYSHTCRGLAVYNNGGFIYTNTHQTEPVVLQVSLQQNCCS